MKKKNTKREIMILAGSLLFLLCYFCLPASIFAQAEARFLALIGSSLRRQIVFWFVLCTVLSSILPNAVVCATIAYATPLGGEMNLVTVDYLEQLSGHKYMYTSWVICLLPIMSREALHSLILFAAKAVLAFARQLYQTSGEHDRNSIRGFQWNKRKNRTENFPKKLETAEILFTTGTIGKSKGIELSHGSVVAVAENGSDGVEMKKENVELIPVRRHYPRSYSCAVCYKRQEFTIFIARQNPVVPVL